MPEEKTLLQLQADVDDAVSRLEDAVAQRGITAEAYFHRGEGVMDWLRAEAGFSDALVVLANAQAVLIARLMAAQADGA